MSRHVLTLILDKHQLMMHLHAIKKYLLLGQGDFVQALMDLTWEELWRTDTHYDHHWTGARRVAPSPHGCVAQSLAARDHLRLLQACRPSSSG